MTRHSESLRYFSTNFSGLFSCLEHVDYNFSQLTKLEHLVLWYEDLYSRTDVDVAEKLVSEQCLLRFWCTEDIPRSWRHYQLLLVYQAH